VQARNPGVPLLSTRHAHNDYLQALAETGIIGFCAMLASWIWMVVRSLRSPTPWGRIGLAAMVSFAVAGLFEANYLDSEVIINLFLWIAFATAPLPAPTPINLAFSPALD
jgi:O-antigen ligase